MEALQKDTLKKVGVMLAVVFVGVAVVYAISYRKQAGQSEGQLADSKAQAAAAEPVAGTNSAGQYLVKAKGETVITYGQLERRRSLQLVINKTRQAEIRVSAPDSDFTFSSNPDTLAFLRREVERLVSTNAPTMLGHTGISFKFRGGLPIWGPYQLLHGHRQCRCLIFAEHATVGDKCVEASGRARKDGYWPYRLASSK